MGGESYLAGLISFAAFIISFLVVLHVLTNTGWLFLQIMTGTIIHIIFSFGGHLVIDEFSYWYQASLYVFLWFCFFFVSSIYSASVSVGIISYLHEQPHYSASIQDVYQNCILNNFEQRVEFLVVQGLAKKTTEGYTSTLKGTRTVNRLQLINNILGMESRGFYSSNSALMENRNINNDQGN